jgi:alanyl-tRNA synthetase
LCAQIVSESGIAAGVRRIEAVAGPGLYDLLSARETIVKSLSLALKVQPEKLEARVATMAEEQRKLFTEVERLKARMPAGSDAPDVVCPATLSHALVCVRIVVPQTQLALAKADALMSAVKRLPSGAAFLVHELEGVDAASLGVAAQRMQERLGDPAAVVLGSVADDKVSLVAAFSPGVVKGGLAAGKFLGPLAKLCEGGGGGKPAFAQAGGRNPARLGEALQSASADLERLLS